MEGNADDLRGELERAQAGGLVMHPILIYDFDGENEVADLQQLRSVLCRRDRDESNAFECSPAEMAYPFLSIMVSGDRAVVHYVQFEEMPGSQSLGDQSRASEPSLFKENSSGATIELPGSAVVSADAALKCAEQFATEPNQRPDAIAWFEL